MSANLLIFATCAARREAKGRGSRRRMGASRMAITGKKTRGWSIIVKFRCIVILFIYICAAVRTAQPLASNNEQI